MGLAGRRLSRSAKVSGGMAKLQAVISTGHRGTCLCHATLWGGGTDTVPVPDGDLCHAARGAELGGHHSSAR